MSERMSSSARKRLGERLVAAKGLTGEQVELALGNQAVYGGRIGTNLVELEYASIEDVGRCLSEQRGVPLAGPEQLDAVDPAALAVLSADLCAKHGVLPLGRSGDRFQVAMIDPSAINVARLSLHFEQEVEPFIVPELRLYYYVEKHYGITRPSRFLRLPDGGEADGRRRRYLAATVSAPDFGETEEEWQGRTTDVTPLRAIESGSYSGSSGGLQRIPTARRRPIEAVLARLRRAESGVAIARALVSPLSLETACSVLFWVRNELAVACCASGPERGQLDELVVSLKEPSLFEWAMEMGGVVRSDAADDPMQQRIAEFLDLPPPLEVCIAPVLLGDRVVNLICVQSGPENRFPDLIVEQMVSLSEAAARAYNRLQQRLKTDSHPSVGRETERPWES
jgi:hypothetical protein